MLNATTQLQKFTKYKKIRVQLLIVWQQKSFFFSSCKCLLANYIISHHNRFDFFVGDRCTFRLQRCFSSLSSVLRSRRNIWTRRHIFLTAGNRSRRRTRTWENSHKYEGDVKNKNKASDELLVNKNQRKYE